MASRVVGRSSVGGERVGSGEYSVGGDGSRRGDDDRLGRAASRGGEEIG